MIFWLGKELEFEMDGYHYLCGNWSNEHINNVFMVLFSALLHKGKFEPSMVQSAFLVFRHPVT